MVYIPKHDYINLKKKVRIYSYYKPLAVPEYTNNKQNLNKWGMFDYVPKLEGITHILCVCVSVVHVCFWWTLLCLSIHAYGEARSKHCISFSILSPLPQCGLVWERVHVQVHMHAHTRMPEVNNRYLPLSHYSF